MSLKNIYCGRINYAICIVIFITIGHNRYRKAQKESIHYVCTAHSMDNFRNVTGCPVTGLNPEELIETRQLTAATALSLLGHDFENLPRKLSISINGCRHDCTEAQTNDIGLTPALKSIGGRAVAGFVRPMQVTAFCRAILTLFRDHGNREKRTQARLHWLLEEWGMERFHAEVMRAFGERLPTAGQSHLYATPDPLVKDHIGVHPQKQVGLNYVGLVVPAGRFTADQLFALVDVADKYSAHELRLTNDQNIIIPNVPDAKVSALLNEPLLQDWSPTPSGIMRGLVTCTGKDHCHFALNDTKSIALEIAQRLAQRFPDTDKVVRLNVSSCVYTGVGGTAGKELKIAMVLNSNGQGITLAKSMAPTAGYGSAAGAKAAIDAISTERVPSFAMTFPGGTHDLWLRYWLGAAQVDQTKVQIKTIPPPQMVANMKVGNMDGYCVGEPWNGVAVKEDIGYTHITTQDIWTDHPEKALVVNPQFAATRRDDLKKVMRAILEASIWLDKLENRQETADVIGGAAYVNAPADVIAARLEGKYTLGAVCLIKPLPMTICCFTRMAL